MEMTLYISLLLLLLDCSGSVDSAQTELTPPPTNRSVCPGDVLTYICTACGPGSTLWKGTAFRCSSTQNEVILQHSRYNSSGGTTRYCNDRGIVGQSLRSFRVEDNDIYISQLNATISMDMNEKTIECAHTTTAGLRTIGVRTLSVHSVPSPPEGVQLSQVRLSMEEELIEFSFNWTNAIMNPFYYLITSTNCGTCPTNTTETTVVCKNLLRTDDPPPCVFSVQSVSQCGVIGTASDQVKIVPKVPEAPTVISVIPHYSNDSKTLTSISITINGTASSSAIIDHLNVSINITSAANPEVTVMNVQPICGNICDYEVDVHNLCLGAASNVFATVSASNLLGQGPATDLLNISCTNRFVNVNYDSNTNILSCSFQEQPLTATNKSCNITYGPCNQNPIESVENVSTSDTVQLKLESDINLSKYCYRVIASNGTFTIFIEKGDSEITKPGTSVTMLILLLLLLVPFAIIIIIIIIVTVYFCKRRRHNNITMDAMHDFLRKQDLHKISAYFKECTVEEDCELKEFMDSINDKRKSGEVYYQLKEKENIYEDKSLIFKDESGTLASIIDTAKLHTQSDEVRLFGQEVTPLKSKWTVFVQSKGSGARHLPAGSKLLYQVKEYDQSSKHPLLPIYDKEHFKISKVKEESTFEVFCEQELKCNHSTSPVFLELGHVEEDKITHVIHKKKLIQDGPQFFVGSAAHIKERNEAEWQTFVQVVDKGNFTLSPDTSVLHQNITTHSFHVWTVDTGNVRLSKFVEKKLNRVGSFENGKAFYEFSKDADKDHLCYRGAIIIDKSCLQDNTKECQAEVCIQSYDFLCGKSSDSDVFIECISFGARHLKMGQKILYKKDSDS